MHDDPIKNKRGRKSEKNGYPTSFFIPRLRNKII